eukprot:Nk52_evm12s2325 gene=Nk52_evmTU12s2325
MTEAASKLDMPLDDLVAANRQSRRGNRNPSRGGGAGKRNNSGNRGGATRNGGIRKGGGNNRPNMNNGMDRRGGRGGGGAGRWPNDRYESGVARNILGGGISTGAKLLFSNLHYDVSDQDLRDLCEDFGAVKKVSIFYDAQGRSQGTGEVVFQHKTDAINAMRKYNNVELDGLPMSIQIVTSGTGPVVGTGNIIDRVTQRGGGPPIFNVNPRGGGGRHGGRAAAGGIRGGNNNNNNSNNKNKNKNAGGRQKREKPKPKTAEELDAELESYMSAKGGAAAATVAANNGDSVAADGGGEEAGIQ